MEDIQTCVHRLLAILLLLQTRGRMTAHELAEQLEVSERTIYRDMEALSEAGIPVYAERGPGGGCSLLDGYQTRLTGLTATEVRALFLLRMASPLADLGLNKALDDALLKLLASLPNPAQRCGTGATTYPPGQYRLECERGDNVSPAYHPGGYLAGACTCSFVSRKP